MGDTTIRNIDDLEDAIDAAGIGYKTLILSYREFIAELVGDGSLRQIPEAGLEKIRRYLDRMPAIVEAQDPAARKRLAIELWQYADASKDRPDLVELVRCLIYMTADLDEWDTYAQYPMIFYFLVHLRRIIGDIDTRFVAHFRKALFAG